MAAVDYFLKIEGVDGESTDVNHKAEIEVESFSFGLSNTGSAIGSATGGGGAGKASFQDFHFTARVSKASPQLFLACASGKHIGTATFTARKAGGEQQPFMKIDLGNVLVSSFQEGGATDNFPTDQCTLNFQKVIFSYSATQPDGALGQPLLTNWNVSVNRAG
ncbi:MAG: Hcp family type VI secretion system effector [Acidimicrobiales bacterium]